MPVLGYDVDPHAHRLVVNQGEAARVQEVFQLYLQLGGLVPTVEELGSRGWTGKRWTTRKGIVRPGKPLNKTSLYYLLTNVTYRGRVKYQHETYDGEHEPIVSEEVFRQVQSLLHRNRRTRRLPRAATYRGILGGLLYCAACQSQMIHTYTNKGARRYRYYLCGSAQKRGRESCPSKSIPAREIERFVTEEVRKEVLGGSTPQPQWWDYGAAQQAEMLARWVDRVEYDGRTGDLHIRLKPGNGRDGYGSEHDHPSPHPLSRGGPTQGTPRRTP